MHILVLHTSFLVIYLDFLSANRPLWLVNSWWRTHGPDQIQMYPDSDTIAQLLPACRIQQHVISAWLNYIHRKFKTYIFMKKKIKVKLWKRTRTKGKTNLKNKKERKGKTIWLFWSYLISPTFLNYNYWRINIIIFLFQNFSKYHKSYTQGSRLNLYCKQLEFSDPWY